METSGEAGSEDITCRSMEQKGYEVGKTHRVAQSLGNEGHPTTPPCFAKRVCKRLKINGAPAQKRGKREAREIKSPQATGEVGVARLAPAGWRVPWRKGESKGSDR